MADQQLYHEQDTSAALNTLFHTTQEEYPLELSIDPALSDAAEQGALPPAPASAPSAPSVPSPGGDHERADESPKEPAPKRRATSRANMLARGGACEFCKRRKLKCTAEMPQCASCRRTGRECVYSQKKQRSRVRILEDRLMELEKRLSERGQGEQGGRPSTASDVTPSTNYDAPSSAVDLFSLGLGDGLTLADVPMKRTEPDLMTLADAAAADTGSYPWEGMAAQDIVAALVKHINENDKGVGQKIMQHLLQTYSQSSPLRMVSTVVTPQWLFQRASGPPLQHPHNALIAALLPNIMYMSPSETLHRQSTIAAVTDALVSLSRALSAAGLANMDPRIVDLVAAASLRCIALSSQGRFVDAWNENSLAIGLVWSTGIGKLGGVGEIFVPPEQRPADRAERVKREERLRMIRGKGQIVPAAGDRTELAERIRLFWGAYLVDRSSALGWSWPAIMDEREITTPFPSDDAESVEALNEHTTLNDFLAGRGHTTAGESLLTSTIKGVTLAYEASRLLDRTPELASAEATTRLLRLTKRHMVSLRPFEPANRDEALRDAGWNDVWMQCHAAEMMLHLKEEIDAVTPPEEVEARDKAIDAGLRLCTAVQTALEAGDTELSGYDMTAPLTWYVCGRSFHHLARRVEAAGDTARAQLLRDKLQFLVEATQKMSKAQRLAEVHAQMLFNVSNDSEIMLGEYVRPDNIDVVVDSL